MNITSIPTDMLSLIIFLIICIISLVKPIIHACHNLKRHLLALEGDKDVFDSVLKPLITQSLIAIGKDTNLENSDDSPIRNCKAINLFCE